MAESIEEDLLSFVQSRVSDGESLEADTDLIEHELLDSLLIMDLVAHLEGRYRVRLENADIAPRNFRTVQALSRLVGDRRPS